MIPQEDERGAIARARARVKEIDRQAEITTPAGHIAAPLQPSLGGKIRVVARSREEGDQYVLEKAEGEGDEGESSSESVMGIHPGEPKNLLNHSTITIISPFSWSYRQHVSLVTEQKRISYVSSLITCAYTDVNSAHLQPQIAPWLYRRQMPRL
jgi:hypothetical protein